MTIDPTGTEPGIHTKQPVEKTVAMRCRFENCNSLTAKEVIPSASETGVVSSNRIYQCVTCSGTWTLSVGGSFNY